jgi:RNA polymerase sigma-70 factor (ECF subfamily)
VIATAAQPSIEDGLDLVRRHQAGDRSAFAEIYSSHYTAIFKYVLYRVYDRHLAEDLAQDTFTKAFARLSTNFECRDKAIGAWLVTIARNLVADHFKRAEHRRRGLPIDAMSGHEAKNQLFRVQAPAADELALTALDIVDLLTALLALTEHQQTVIILRYFMGLSVAETCHEMSLTGGAVKALTFRAVRALARHMNVEDWL